MATEIINAIIETTNPAIAKPFSLEYLFFRASPTMLTAKPPILVNNPIGGSQKKNKATIDKTKPISPKKLNLLGVVTGV